MVPTDMSKLCFLIFFLGLNSAAFSQCKHSISLNKVVNETGNRDGGLIEVSVKSSDNYIAVLHIEKGSGPEKIAEKRGSGNAVVRFTGLDVQAIYQVQLEFLSDDTHCRKLQKSQITFESE